MQDGENESRLVKIERLFSDKQTPQEVCFVYFRELTLTIILQICKIPFNIVKIFCIHNHILPADNLVDFITTVVANQKVITWK